MVVEVSSVSFLLGGELPSAWRWAPLVPGPRDEMAPKLFISSEP